MVAPRRASPSNAPPNNTDKGKARWMPTGVAAPGPGPVTGQGWCLHAPWGPRNNLPEKLLPPQNPLPRNTPSNAATRPPWPHPITHWSGGTHSAGGGRAGTGTPGAGNPSPHAPLLPLGLLGRHARGVQCVNAAVATQGQGRSRGGSARPRATRFRARSLDAGRRRCNGLAFHGEEFSSGGLAWWRSAAQKRGWLGDGPYQVPPPVFHLPKPQPT